MRRLFSSVLLSLFLLSCRSTPSPAPPAPPPAGEEEASKKISSQKKSKKSPPPDISPEEEMAGAEEPPPPSFVFFNDEGEEILPPDDPLAYTAMLLKRGWIKEARERFDRADVRSLAQGPREGEWRLWRSRLYTMALDAAALGLQGGNVASLLIDADDVWAGTWTGGVSRFSVGTDEKEVFDPGITTLAVRTVNRILREDETIWVLRYGGMERYDRRRSVWTSLEKLPVKERLQDMVVYPSRVYLGTLGQGLWIQEEGVWRQVKQAGAFITRLEKDPQGNLLVGTMDKGPLIIEEPEGKMIFHSPPQGPLAGANITSLAARGEEVYAGTYGQGLFVWNRTVGAVSHFSGEVIGNNWVLALAVGKKRLYLGTFGSGIVSYNWSSGDWKQLTIADGLPGRDVTTLSWRSGELWAGTLGGGVVRINEDIYETKF